MRVSVASESQQQNYLYLVATLLGTYLAVWSARPIAVLMNATADDMLFMRLSSHILSGDWLGPYNHYTLVKGPGYPLFLAVSHLSGISTSLLQALVWFIAATFFSIVCSRILNAKSLFPVLLIALLFLPVAYSGELARVFRDFLYMTVSLAFFAALLNLMLGSASSCLLSRGALTGFWAGLVWLTREEGVWILPTSAGLLFLLWFQKRTVPWRNRLRHFGAGILGAAVTATSVIFIVGLVNLWFYGSFVAIEMKETNFQRALTALQKASFPDWQPYLPVPRAARFRIYEQSPTFARLKPFLDPEHQSIVWDVACRNGIYPETCGDIGGGWFMWALRDAAAQAGAHRSAPAASRFYASLANEIETACSLGRLACTSWLPPFVPAVTSTQLFSLPSKFLDALGLSALLKPFSFEARSSVLLDGQAETIAMLNHPLLSETTPRRYELRGWYYRNGGGWISLKSSAATLVSLARLASPDLVAAFSDPAATQQRYHLQATCDSERPCRVTFVDNFGNAATLEIGPKLLGKSHRLQLGDGTIMVDAAGVVGVSASPIKRAIFDQSNTVLAFMKPIYQTVIILGALAFLAVMLDTVLTRTLTAGFIAASTLLVAVLTRALILALLELSSFPSINYAYFGPASALALGFAIISLYEASFRLVGGRCCMPLVRGLCSGRIISNET
jgi:hypothetical protein